MPATASAEVSLTTPGSLGYHPHEAHRRGGPGLTAAQEVA